MSDQNESPATRTSARRRFGWSLRTMDQARVQQLLVIFAASAILATVGFIIASMMAVGNYPLGFMAIVDAATALALCLAIWLAFRQQALRLQILLICMCIPINLVSEVMLQGAGAWIGLMLLGLSAFMWGLLTPLWMATLYTAGLVAFFNIYLASAPEAVVLFHGRNETFLTAIALSIVAMASALAAILPRKITGAAYGSLNKAARQETILKQRFAHYATLASDWHLEIDEHGTVTDFFGTGDAVGRNWRTIIFDWEAQADTFHQALKTRTPYEKIRATLNLEGQSRRVECTGEPVFHEDGAFAGYRVIAHDITEKAEAEEKLKVLALRDRLTGLGNRHAFNASIEAGQNRPPSEQTAVICIDLDNFKHINDRQGHEAGDIALCELGARFRGLEEDIPGLEVFRLGGDEFCALLQVRWDAEGGNRLAARFADAISRPSASPPPVRRRPSPGRLNVPMPPSTKPNHWAVGVSLSATEMWRHASTGALPSGETLARQSPQARSTFTISQSSRSGQVNSAALRLSRGGATLTTETSLPMSSFPSPKAVGRSSRSVSIHCGEPAQKRFNG